MPWLSLCAHTAQAGQPICPQTREGGRLSTPPSHSDGNAQTNQIRHHRQGRLVALQRQAQLLHVVLDGHPPELLVPLRQPQAVAHVHVALDLVDDAAAVLQQGRGPLGQVRREDGCIVLQDVKDAVQGMELGQDGIEFGSRLPDFPNKAPEGR